MNNKKSTYIRTLHDKDIASVAKLHSVALDSPGSAIGLPYLTRLYQHYSRNPKRYLCFVVKNYNRIIGAVAVCIDSINVGTDILGLIDGSVVVSLLKAVILLKLHPLEIMRHRQVQQYIRNHITNKSAYISQIFIEPSHQNKGIGTMLCRHLFRHLLNNKVDCVFVDTQHSNVPAQQFYKKLAFKKVAILGNTHIFVKYI